MRLRLPHRNKRPAGHEMKLMDHLRELRRRIIFSLIVLLVGSIVTFALFQGILHLLIRPLCEVEGKRSCTLYVTGPVDGFAWRVRVALYSAVFLVSPFILYQLWRFIAPGLRKNERRYSISFILSSVLLFTLGGLIAYLVFPKVLQFLQGAAGASLHPLYTPSSFLGFELLLMLAFGVAFEFPVVLITLELLGVVTPQRLAKSRRWAIVIIFTIAAVFLPSSDPYSLFALAIPLIVFYELSILVGRIATRRRRLTEAG